jgi:hypothetical protein
MIAPQRLSKQDDEGSDEIGARSELEFQHRPSTRIRDCEKLDEAKRRI